MPLKSSHNPNASFHALLLRQALLRSQVQTAIYELIRNYELASGYAVVRLDFQQSRKRVVIDALPAREGSGRS